MSDRFNKQEKAHLQAVIRDLHRIFEVEKCSPEEIDSLTKSLETDEVKDYLLSLRDGSSPEAALRESLLAGQSILSKYLFVGKSPEVATGGGFIDYKLHANPPYLPVLVEIKPLFVQVYKKQKGRRILTEISQNRLQWQLHRKQIQKYLRENDFLVLTNLKEWYFFSRKSDEPILKEPTSLGSFLEEFETIGDLNDYLERIASRAVRDVLDRNFFDSLDSWVKALRAVEFESTVSGKKKLELIIKLINKFIFIQTLDDYGIIDFHWLPNKWELKERGWKPKGQAKVLEEFFKEIDEWFYDYYDTELFQIQDSFLKYVKKTPDNIKKLYSALKLVVGLELWQKVIRGGGIINYNYRYIDEDIFGKAYETFLAGVRKEQGIFYTPASVTRYIVEHTVGEMFDQLVERLATSIQAEDYDSAFDAVCKMKELRVLDPACGSGSFLIKALRIIWQKYQQAFKVIEDALDQVKEYYKVPQSHKQMTLNMPEKSKTAYKKLLELREVLGPPSPRKLLSTIMLRHIYGNDKDKRAIDVAKVNIWLEAIKQAPAEFRYSVLETPHILPNLEANLTCGDSLVGLPDEASMGFLRKNHSHELKTLFKLRAEYLEHPERSELADRIKEVKNSVREKVVNEFRTFLKERKLPEALLEITNPLSWPLEFWYVFFKDDEHLSPNDERGFEVVIGNPPWRRIKEIEDQGEKKAYSKYFGREELYVLQRGNRNLYKLFLERSYTLLKKGGRFSMLFPTAFLGEDSSKLLRKEFFENTYVREILEFPEKTKMFGKVT